MDINDIHYAETQFGFEYGAATVERLMRYKSGAVAIGVNTPKAQLQVYVTKTGKIRVWLGSRELTTKEAT